MCLTVDSFASNSAILQLLLWHFYISTLKFTSGGLSCINSLLAAEWGLQISICHEDFTCGIHVIERYGLYWQHEGLCQSLAGCSKRDRKNYNCCITVLKYLRVFEYFVFFSPLTCLKLLFKARFYYCLGLRPIFTLLLTLHFTYYELPSEACACSIKHHINMQIQPSVSCYVYERKTIK